MKWWFLFFFRSISVGGPFDTEQQCVNALKSAIDAPVAIDRGFDKTDPTGLCFQAVRPPRS